MGQMIEFARPDGQRAPGYYAAPGTGEHAPGVVMIEEWWGVTPEVTATADRLAGEGFRVLVPDLFRGRSAATPDEATHLRQGLDFADAGLQDVRGAAQHLRAGSAGVGVMGFCMGGALALFAAMHVAEVSAAAPWYGVPDEAAGDPAKIAIPVLGIWANQDGFVTPDVVNRLEERFKAGHVSYEFHRYDARHGFYNKNPMGSAGLGNYHREAAESAWKHTVDFFKRTLR